MDTNQNHNQNANENDMLQQLLKQKEEFDCRFKEFVAERKIVEKLQAKREAGAQLAGTLRQLGEKPEVAEVLAMLAAHDAALVELI